MLCKISLFVLNVMKPHSAENCLTSFYFIWKVSKISGTIHKVRWHILNYLPVLLYNLLIYKLMSIWLAQFSGGTFFWGLRLGAVTIPRTKCVDPSIIPYLCAAKEQNEGMEYCPQSRVSPDYMYMEVSYHHREPPTRIFHSHAIMLLLWRL